MIGKSGIRPLPHFRDIGAPAAVQQGHGGQECRANGQKKKRRRDANCKASNRRPILLAVTRESFGQQETA
jgi:hypothetical protein